MSGSAKPALSAIAQSQTLPIEVLLASVFSMTHYICR